MSIPKLSAFFLLTVVGIIPSFSQIIKDTVYIEFKKSTDKIKERDNKVTAVWIQNENYAEEMETYKHKRKKFESSGDTILPPTTPVPVEPNKFFKYFLVDHLEIYYQPTSTKIEPFLNRKKLKNLDPSKRIIFVVRETEEAVILYPVSFYQNVIE